MASEIVRAVAYYRMSTTQQDASIPEQREWAGRAAPQNGADIVAEFQDDGIAGSEIGRRGGLMDLLAYCEARAESDPIGAVLCWDADRLSRADSIRTAAVLDRLMTAGVTRLLTQEGWVDFESDLDRLLFNIKQDMSRSAFSKSLSKNVTRSGIRRAREGRWVCGRPPYGYAVGPDGHLTPGDPVKAEAVRWIFRTYTGTAASLGDMARRLSDTATPAPQARTSRRDGKMIGGRWTRFGIRSVLMNRAYTGDMVWNVKRRGKFNRVTEEGVAAALRPKKKTRAPQKNDAKDYIVTADAHPALVDRQTFDATARKLARSFRKGTTPIPGGGGWVLSGRLHCGHCRCSMAGITDRQTRKGATYTYKIYWCTANAKHGSGTCHTNRIHQDAILEQVAGLLRCELTTPERLERLRAEVEANARADAGARQAERDQLTARVHELDRQLDQGAERLLTCPAEAQARVGAKFKEWQIERDRAARELARLDTAEDQGEVYAERVAGSLHALQQLEEALADAPPDVARDVLANLVTDVRLKFSHQRLPNSTRQRTRLVSFQVDIVPDVADALGIPPTITSPVKDWKKYPIGNQTFEEIDRRIRGGR
jgi:DNA invertase Pin-like site-specific DNA recombinase